MSVRLRNGGAQRQGMSSAGCRTGRSLGFGHVRNICLDRDTHTHKKNVCGMKYGIE